MAMGLNHLVQWVDKGVLPPKAPRAEVDGNTENDGSLLALDEHGNLKGGVRNTYVDVPMAKFIVPNKGKEGLPAEVRADFYCNITGYDVALTADKLRSLYRDKRDYQAKVDARLKELTRQGWFLPVYERQVLDDAAKVTLP